ncbi:hypothetical protein Halru_0014 [Halovivax ruber XH-70]|uniref:Uncharacterized protein n=1 Tax=Halovivax ruber (strain DSM 18193 / JCM 13892 / XH-70) TaxID=797302 RepID=L0I7K2_HALRX|nr:hypothetical protein [Halovivax ruber]AGB14669.1 hypothetical protein Halru_0014 [Halovivax ruber XH-70]
MALTRFAGSLLQLVVTVAVLVALGIAAFFVSVFVVSRGAWLAGYEPSGDFVVLAASLLVVAALLGGIPFGRQTEPAEPQEQYDTTGFQ